MKILYYMLLSVCDVRLASKLVSMVFSLLTDCVNIAKQSVFVKQIV